MSQVRKVGAFCICCPSMKSVGGGQMPPLPPPRFRRHWFENVPFWWGGPVDAVVFYYSLMGLQHRQNQKHQLLRKKCSVRQCDNNYNQNVVQTMQQ